MKYTVIIGAGASVPFGLPTTKMMYQEIKAQYSQPGKDNDVSRTLLHTFEDILGSKKIDIEYVYNLCNIILDKRYGSFPPAARAWFAFTTGGTKNENLIVIKKLRDNIENYIIERFWKVGNIPQIADKYDKFFNKCGIDFNNDEVFILTTNYDNILEWYFRSKGIDIETGVQTFNNYPIYNLDKIEKSRKLIKLFKVHGSINFYSMRKTKQIVVIDDAHKTGDFIHSVQDRVKSIFINFPDLHKIEYERSYLKKITDIMLGEIVHSEKVISLGYSFRDELIQKVLLDAFRDYSKGTKMTKEGNNLFGVEPTMEIYNRSPIASEVIDQLSESTLNIKQISYTFE